MSDVSYNSIVFHLSHRANHYNIFVSSSSDKDISGGHNS
jgi:hypothetical protein